MNIVADACTLKIKNIFVAGKKTPLDDLDRFAEDQVFNTGASSLGNPHSDEAAENAGKVFVTDANAFEKKHIAAIRLYRTNSYLYLEPKDEVTLVTKSGDETLYYLDQKTEMISVEVVPGAAASVVSETTDEPQSKEEPVEG